MASIHLVYVGIRDSLTTSTVVEGLTPYTLFRFAIRSHSGSMVGHLSDEIHCRTAEGRKYYGLGMYRIFDSCSLRCRIMVRIVYSYSAEQPHHNEYE